MTLRLSKKLNFRFCLMTSCLCSGMISCACGMGEWSVECECVCRWMVSGWNEGDCVEQALALGPMQRRLKTELFSVAMRHIYIAGIAQWLERRTRDWKVAGSNPCWSGGRIFFSRVNFLCWLLFRYPFHPRVTAVARKRPRSFCLKRRWQVTAKHAYTLRMWLCMKWHGAWLYGVHRTRRDWLSLAADSCGTSHASAVSTPLRWIFKNAL